MTTPAASPIADALVTILSSASVLGPQTTAKNDYNFLQSASISAVVQWTSLAARRMTFGTNMTYIWSFNIACYIRDTGDPNNTMNNVWLVGDKVAKAMHDNPTLLDTCQEITEFNMTRQPGIAYTLRSGEAWLPFDLNVSVREWD